MQKSAQIIFGLILFIAGFLGGFLAQQLYGGIAKNSIIKSYASQYASVDFSSCRQLSLEDVQTCVDGMLAASAERQLSPTLCAEIQNVEVRTKCNDRLDFLNRLGVDAGAFCQGISDDPLCRDLATILIAQAQNKREACATILSENLRAACSEIMAASLTDLPEPTKEQLSGEASPKGRLYGLVCPSFDQDCQNAISSFNSAVRSGSDDACKSLGMYAELCLNESALYRAYTTGNLQACTARQPEEICLYHLAVAREMDGQSGLCNNLELAPMRDACAVEVADAAGGKRFDYLQS